MKHTLLVVLLALFAGLLACGDDDTVGPPPQTPSVPVFQNLSQQWHVLNNLELAYNRRNIDRLNALLDENFTFYLTDKDVQGGLPEYWGRAEEFQISRRMFSTEQPANGAPRVTSIHLDIHWEDNLAWVDVSAPINDETWYLATVFVDFKIEVEPDITFISNAGTRAQFLVRNAGTVDAPRWSLVEIRDLGAPSGPPTVAAAATEPATWGHVKALFL